MSPTPLARFLARFSFICLAFVGLLLPLPQAVFAQGGEISVRCETPDDRAGSDVTAVCDLRSLTRAAINESEVTVADDDGRSLDFSFVAFQPRINTSAVLFVVQTGGKAHPNDSSREIENIVQQTGRRLFGLYTFASDIDRAVRLGDSAQQLQNSLARRRSREAGVDLFGALDRALDDLEGIRADRRSIVLLGDGTHTDGSVEQADVVAKAQRLNVPIFAIAMTDNRVDASIKTGLNTLRALAEDTNGYYQDAGPRRQVSSQFIGDFYHFVENGGDARIVSALTSGPLSVTVELSNGRRIRRSGIALIGAAQAGQTAVARSDTDGTTSGSRDDETDTADLEGDKDAADDEGGLSFEGLTDDPIGWVTDNPFPAASALVAIIGLLALAVVVLVRPKRDAYSDPGGEISLGGAPNFAADGVAAAAGPGGDPTILMGVAGSEDVIVPDLADTETRPTGTVYYGFLEFLDSDETRAPITETNVRIGRHRDNDICIENHSVHRQHAVIFQDSDGSFVIRDLGTKNGVIVNKIRGAQTKLTDGDIIELGEVRLRFVA
ncbi:MAG: FHA domain-containing protein, partial [Pseudomonadota bacterium]